jgi:signal transduction histidine kinase/PAS domain-containing protein
MGERERMTEMERVRRDGRGAAELFAGPGEVRALARTLDWGATPLGWPEAWSPALRIATRAIMDSPFPICLWSGPEFALVYNDGYRRILAAKHPAALGQPGSVVWAEIWEGLAAQFAQVRDGGPPIYFENARFVMARLQGGRTEDAWFSYSLSALRDEDGAFAAVLNISPETTGQVLAESALELERKRLTAVFQQSPSFVAVLRGPDNVFESVNAAYEQIVGPGRALLGRPLLEALPEIRGQGFDTALDAVRRTGEPRVLREHPLRLERTPGAPLEERFVDITWMPLVEADGMGATTREAVIAHGTDVTEQVRARREIERARDRSDLLQSLTAELAATHTPDQVADVVVERGVAAAGAAVAFLTLRATNRDDDADLVFVRQSGLPRGTWDEGTPFSSSSPVPSARSVRTGEPVFVDDAGELRAAFPEVREAWDTLDAHALATVPLAVGGETVGALSFVFRAPRAFSPEDREFFLALGRQAAQALERARLSEAEHTARARAESLQRVTSALAGAHTLADVGRIFSRELTTLVAADTVWVGVVSLDGTVVEALGWAGYGEGEADQWKRLPLDAGIALTDVVRSARPQWWPTREAIAAAYPARAAAILSLPQDAVALLPLLADGAGEASEALGGVVVGFRTPRRFDADTRAFYLALAQQCAQAIARARAYEAEQAARREAEAARQAAEAANRAKSEFLAVMSHELRTPLNAIGGYAELMEMGIHGAVTPEQRIDLERIQRAQRHLLGLINGVLNYARIDAGALDYELADVALDEVLATCEALVAPQALAKRLDLHRAPCDPALRVRADREKAQQVILNLLSNAVKFTPPGGRIVLEGCVRDARTVEVRVSDTGTGIAAAQLDRIFQPFVQLDATLTRTHDGTGLGLAISRDLARGMGGDLTAESTPGSGSTFTFILPIAP